VRLDQAEEALRAIRHGEVDALVVWMTEGDRVFTLQGADFAYRVSRSMRDCAYRGCDFESVQPRPGGLASPLWRRRCAVGR